jgi:hypothetical protein
LKLHRDFRFFRSTKANLASAMLNPFKSFPFEFSVCNDPEHELPPDYPSIIPFRTSKGRKHHAEVSKKANDEWKHGYPDLPAIGRSGALTERGHAISFMFPEIPTDIAEDWVKIYEALLVWDGIWALIHVNLWRCSYLSSIAR